MRLTATIAALLVSIGLAVQAPAPTLAANETGGCAHYAYSGSQCATVPARGRFYVHVTREPILLYGYGNYADAGHHIYTAPTAPPCPGTRAYGFVLDSDGPFPPLMLASAGALYQYNEGTGTCTRITQILGPGEYEVVLPGGTISTAMRTKHATRSTHHSSVKHRSGKHRKH